ncbi:hypothetical protein A3J19_02200 [Candidatus Daviesbacteria bacterium RIFCSPLOWO2_02_FULL_41_8]|uniref:Uncharacterized protein n=3 Tax=Candidatus Daviesiibacteriota TaxID=1752718 RepID=A0A1F5NHF0_9BACT|nr:MAG: hypothetical protein A2871_01200 [Candidatus Daviesbacteria bacterium RIFCSPHIGHO2_01_FULL_41_23]OGE32659.1 MAG: hypothetical protein A3D83_01565 [Candidatus Daviesbacteria bacterium RIFCSPHIGHO2_02_FULL_41_10]OGE62511.1 MAG: hypothetical protein A2967_01685 [Candidatus Daviesbacteria bacterium RIFCSPLOWO2_01_FULL_41_32]OGE77107.1 MAG: hypothetical protein A3J19_02200 [Candidatus Daviesbacteria bacterium RIFCSPLOWO2_02_FULL_41_8]
MFEAKSIRTIDYSEGQKPPPVFETQTRQVFWEAFHEWFIYTPFTRNLARTYIPSYQAISESEHRYPVDIYLDFKSFNVIVHPLAEQLKWIFTAAGGNIVGKRILDLGCGSNGNTIDSKEFGALFRPWLCRTLLELGAEPIGVDFGDLNGEKFEAHSRDLSLPESLNFVPDDSVDIIHSRALHTSPQLSELRVESGHLMEILNPQIMRILKPQGVFLFSKDF